MPIRRVVKVAWSLGATFVLVVAFFLFLVVPARAPHGGKKFLGGRTIASMQEQEFDQRILQYQLCYGVKFAADRATLERRRVCKAMLVHQLDRALSRPGAHFKAPMEFHCEDTVFSRPTGSDFELSIPLQPNAEFSAIEKALGTNLEVESVGESSDRFAREACDFLTDCKLAMTSAQWSFRKLAACFSTSNVTHRKILLDEVGVMLFRAKKSPKMLYADLLQEAHK